MVTRALSRLRAAARRGVLRSVAARPRRQAGFTLIELIIVIAIIGILATIVMPQLINQPKRASEAVLKTDLRTLRDLLDQYYADKGHYPADLQDLVTDGYIRAIPVDPMTKSNETWVVDYEAPPAEGEAPAETDQPEGSQPGIIDVHSGSTAIGRDGRPYSEW